MDHLKSELWIKIRAFELDERGIAFPFSKKLANEQNWTEAFTKRAIEEYRKFIYLCVISPNGASPSNIIDEVWHLHLTYTTCYWKQFCLETIGKEIHHHPSKGGNPEKDKHLQWYNDTIELYHSVFGQSPPTDIWPLPIKHENLYFPPELPKKFETFSIQVTLLLLAVPFTASWFLFDDLDPFDLNGPDFLIFYAILIAACFAGFFVYLQQQKQVINSFLETHFPKDYTIYQAANFLFGRNRAVQTAVIDALKKDVLELKDDNNFLVQFNGYNYGKSSNPLLPLLMPYEGKTLFYTQINDLLNGEDTFRHVAFENFNRLAYQKINFHWFFLLPAGVIFLCRLVQGISKDKPVGYLVGITILSGVILTGLATNFNARETIYNWCKKRFEAEPLGNLKLNSMDEILRSHVIYGTEAVKGFREYRDLALMFSLYPVVNHFTVTTYFNTGADGGGCSLGASCGSSCGGGCGGCGGD